jgi:hypothetical protein
MGVSEILASIDQEIALLQQARALLAGSDYAAPKRKVGRPRKDADLAIAAKPAKKADKTKKRNLSPEGRKRIADAVKRRWENQRKADVAK